MNTSSTKPIARGGGRKTTRSSPPSTKSSQDKPTGLERPFPSAPKLPAKFEISIVYGLQGSGFNLHLFAAMYSTKKFLEAIIADDDIHWVGDDRFTNSTMEKDKFAPGEFVVIGNGEKTLREVMDHKYTAAEEAWELPKPYTTYAYQIRALSEPKPAPLPEEPKKKDIVRDATQKQPRAKTSTEGMITIGEIADELKMPPSKARAALRALKLVKPSGGWAWPKEEKEEIKAKIKSA